MVDAYLGWAGDWNKSQRQTSTSRVEGKKMSPAQARAAIARIRSNPEHPYFHAMHPGREAAMKEVERLYALAYKE